MFLQLSGFKIRLLVCTLSAVFGLSACSHDVDTPDSNASVVNAPVMDDWVQDEVLTQVSALRKEISGLKTELKTVREKLEKHLGGKANVKPASIVLKGAESLGDDDADFAIVEFSDFQCPYCARHDKKVFPEIQKKYIDTGKLRYIARDYPLGFHAQAQSAAMAAHCAGDQEEYWDMRHKLFSGGGLNLDRYKKIASELNLDINKFNECLTSNKYADRVDEDLAYGDQAGVNGTPRFYIGRIKNGQLVDVKALAGAQSFTAFERIIEKVINSKS